MNLEYGCPHFSSFAHPAHCRHPLVPERTVIIPVCSPGAAASLPVRPQFRLTSVGTLPQVSTWVEEAVQRERAKHILSLKLPPPAGCAEGKSILGLYSCSLGNVVYNMPGQMESLFSLYSISQHSLRYQKTR